MILRETYQINCIPVDLDMILDTYGLKRIPATFEDLEERFITKGMGDIAGLILPSEKYREIGIFYKRSDSIPNKRFTIAHELGHCCLHGEHIEDGYIEFRNCPTSSDEIEKEANAFADELLLSEIQIRYILDRLLVPSLRALSGMFQVKVSDMRKRLIKLDITFLDDMDDYSQLMYDLIGY